jgi:hypothetical protein
MGNLRKLAAAAVACAALAFGTAGTAEAADPGATKADRKPLTLTAPPAPVGAQDLRAMATSPYTSPASTAGHVNPGATYTCAAGNLCSLAWDPTTGNWEVFRMYYCNLYALSYWNGGGYFWNNQTSGTVARFNGSSSTPTDTAPTGQTYIDWTPVYSIRNC